MEPVSEAIETVRDVLGRIGAAELARRSGVAYTTIRDLETQGFKVRSVTNLEKLSRAATEYLRQERAA